MELSDKRVMIVGLGVSGLAAARFLASRGAKLVMTDRRIDVERGKLPAGALKLGAEDPGWIDGIDLVVTSPGVPRDSILLRAATGRGIPVIGEIELASRFLAAPIAAVTGTNGKSTVVVLLGEILKASGRRTFVGGNLGTPLIDAVDGKWDVAVVEVSSFQLEWIEKFRPRAAVHLNLSDDHFDRYRDLADYGRAKARLFENQDASDYAILNRDDPNVWKLAGGVRSRVIGFGHARGDGEASIWFDDRSNAIVFDLDFDAARRGRISLEGFRLRGRHNISNAMAAAAAALALGVGAEDIERALASFRGLPHRIEVVHAQWRRDLYRRLEGDQRRRGGRGDRRDRGADNSDRRRSRQGRRLRAAEAAARREGQAGDFERSGAGQDGGGARRCDEDRIGGDSKRGG